ncbi:hypothetical protein Tco_1199448 [Tanacetum coccineum]
MSTMAENVIAAGAENRPPMLKRIKNGPFKFGTVEVPATPNTPASTRDIILDDLTPEEKIHEACDIRETNIILQGLELSLQERESKLYNGPFIPMAAGQRKPKIQWTTDERKAVNLD